MTISFNSVPSNLRVPFVAAEFDNSRAAQGPSLLAYRSLLIGQKTGAGASTGSANTLYRVNSADEVAALAGQGSMLHRKAIAYFSANKNATETWILILADSSSAVYATGTIAVSGTASADGTIDLYLGGEHISVSVSANDASTAIASAIAEAIGVRAKGTITCSSADAADNVTIGGTTFVGTTGAVVAGDATYSVDTGDAEAATSLAAQINAHATASKYVHATRSSNVVTVTAHAPGTDGNSIVLTSTDGTDLAVSGSGTLTGGLDGQIPGLPVRATVSSSTVTLTALNAGAVANEYDIRVNYRDGEELPAGVSLTITDMASGATNPTLTSAIAAMGDRWFHIISNPYTDATSLTALENELADRFGPMRMIDGVMFSAKDDTYANCATLGDSRNSPHSCIIRTNDSPTPPAEYAAAVAGTVALYANVDPARPMQTLPLPYVKAPAEGDQDTLQERNLILYDGISTTRVGSGDMVQLERLITTYKESANGSPDTSYLDVTTMLTLLYLRYSFRVRILTRYPRHKLANDGTRFGAGQAVITPLLGKAEAVAWFREMESLGLVEGFAQFKADLIVERNETDPNRLDFKLSPDIINQLMVSAVKIQFLL